MQGDNSPYSRRTPFHMKLLPWDYTKRCPSVHETTELRQRTTKRLSSCHRTTNIISQIKLCPVPVWGHVWQVNIIHTSRHRLLCKGLSHRHGLDMGNKEVQPTRGSKKTKQSKREGWRMRSQRELLWVVSSFHIAAQSGRSTAALPTTVIR